MVINREKKWATLRTYGNTDEYGQELSELLEEEPIEIVFGLYQRNETTDIRYQNTTHYALTDRKDINDKQKLLIGEDEYKIEFVNNFGRLTELFLCQA